MINTIETPSEKNETTENFPVEKLLEAKYRAPVMAYYHFARTADDISDDASLLSGEKIKRLNLMDKALMDHTDMSIDCVVTLRNSLKETGVTPQHARDLLVAFKQDATKTRYNNWEELIDYCRYSANPVGRYLLDLHGEDKSAWPANDALCTVLQIVNHLQDCADDYKDVDRIYIPLDMFKAFNAEVSELSAPSASKELRACIDAMLDHIDPLMEEALTFTGQVKNRRLRIDVAVINNIAVDLITLLRKKDPLSESVKLNKMQKISALARGTLAALFL